MSWETKILSNTRMYQYLTFLLVYGRIVNGIHFSPCEKAISQSYLELATDLINKAKLDTPTCSGIYNKHINLYKPVDCADVLNMGWNKSGTYTIWPMSRISDRYSLDAYCDMDTDGGGWTVFQRRGNFGRAEDYFFQDWKSYKEGFGNIKEDFWLGNDNIFALTNQRPYSVRFDLQDVEHDKRYAVYDSFWIDDEFNNYTLHITGYKGDAGDSMEYHNYQKFSTKDHKNDMNLSSCSESRKGAWWYKSCHYSNLNGLNRRGKFKDTVANGVSWFTWKGHNESLESTEIKIRPKKYE